MEQSSTDPNDRAPVETDVPSPPPTRDEFIAAVGRILDHAEPHGEVYIGATADHVVARRVLPLL